MDQSTKMPKPFDSEHELNAPAAATGIQQQQQFELREDDRLKQEDDYRQGRVFQRLGFT
jgi:hypothetical protein